MKIRRAVELMGQYVVCPRCGSDKLGNGEGTLVVNEYPYEDKFYRSCKCGWEILIDE